ncbi:MAG: hypothetical protein ABL994_21610 [Verrucomicrobiales bacterium]
MDTQRLRQLLDQLDDVKREIAEVCAGNATPVITSPRKTIRCSNCDGEGHTARTCPNKTGVAPQTTPSSIASMPENPSNGFDGQ